MTYSHNGGPPLDDGFGADGWIAIARRMRSHWLVGFGLSVEPQDPDRGSYSRAEAWIDLIMECRYSSGTVMNGGRRMELRPGQLLGATAWLAHRWNWTPKTTRNFLDKLQDAGMIERFAPGIATTTSPDESHPHTKRGQQKGKQASIITICNYGLYQLSPDDNGQANGQAEGKQGASKGQARGNIYKEETKVTKETKEQEDSIPAGPAATAAVPPSPPSIDKDQILGAIGLGAAQLDLLREIADPKKAEALAKFAATEAKKRLRAEQTANENARRAADADQAYSLYNKAAAHFGFSLCESRTEQRTHKLLKRVDDLGGIENFRLALRAIGKDAFLSGRKSAGPGQNPFKLDIDRLLSTESKMGDVLAKLLDLAHLTDEPAMAAPNGKPWGWWRADIDALRKLPPDYWRRRIEAVKPNGTWPWWELGAPPGHDEAIVHPEVIAELKLDEIYKGQVKHD